MAVTTFLDNPVYRCSLELLREHHRLMQRTDGESDMAEAVREEMNDHWADLSEEERAFLWELSADLYMLVGSDVPEPTSAEQLSADQLRALVAEALSRENWLDLLRLLRKDPSLLTRVQLAYLRARAYDGLGHLDVAIEFLQHAVAQEPGSFDYRYLLVEMMIRANQIQDALPLVEAHLANEQSPPDFRMMAGSVLFLYTRGLPPNEARPILQRVVQELRRALTQAEGQTDLSFYAAYAWITVGRCSELPGEIEAAAQAYETAIQLIPGFPEGLSALARLRAGSDLPGAIADLAHSYPPMPPMIQTIREHTVAV